MQPAGQTVEERSSAIPEILGIVRGPLHDAATSIDADASYPREIMRSLGEAGAFEQLASGRGGLVETVDLRPTLDAVAAVATECAATAFCCWCQSALTWYLQCTENVALRDRLLAKVARAEVLGGTALSNPMKADSGLEKLLLRSRTDGKDAWLVSGVIPWVSNIVAGSPFGAVFEVPDSPPAIAVVSDSLEGLETRDNDNFEVMAGTATVSARFRKVRVDADSLLSADATEFIDIIRPGFVLIQAGIGLGLLEAAARVMESTRRDRSQGLQGGLLSTPEDVRRAAARLRDRSFAQADHVARGAGPSISETMQLRLDLAEATIRAATAAQLMAGASGLMRGRRPARLLREAAFYGVLTPSVRHLSHVIARNEGSLATLDTG